MRKIYFTTSIVEFNGEIINPFHHITDTDGLTDLLDYETEITTINKFSKEKTTNAYIDPSNGNVVENASAVLSDYIYCYGQHIIYTVTQKKHIYAGCCAFYDSSKRFISFAVAIEQYENSGKVKVPENAYYVRVTVKTSAPGEEYDPDTVLIKFTPYYNRESEFEEVYKYLRNGISTYPKNVKKYSVKSINLVDTDDVIRGYIATDGSGELITTMPQGEAYGLVSNYVYCKGQKTLYLSIGDRMKNAYGIYASFTDEDFNVIEGKKVLDFNVSYGSCTIPENAVYFRIGVRAINESTWDKTKVYVGFFPFDGTYYPYETQIGDNNGTAYTPGGTPNVPILPSDLINLQYLKQYVGERIGRTPWLVGKTYISMGDSITAPSDSYAKIVSDNFGMTWHNLGVSGCHWVNYDTTKVDFSDNPVHSELQPEHSMNVIQNQVYRLLQMITPIDHIVPEIDVETEFYSDYSYPVMGSGVLDASEIDLVTIACGVNDCSNNKPIGSLIEVDTVSYKELDRKTLWSAMKWAINVIRTHCPNARIVILAPIQRAADRVSLWNYVKNELEAANHFACPAINMFQDVGIMQEIEAVEHKYLSDGLHPNADGKKLMGAIISSKLLGIYNY